MAVIKNIDVLQSGKVFGLIHAVLGLIIGIVLGVVSIMLLGFNEGIGTAILVILFYPIFIGLVGFIWGIAFGAIYNFIASKIGGIKLEIK